MPKKNPAVHALAQEGGLARARALTPEQRREIAKKAAQARWGSPDKAGNITYSHMMAADGDGATRAVQHQVEIDAFEEIWKKVRSHTISATCPCDECVDSVMAEIRTQYVKVLAKIDKGEKLDKREGIIFRLLTRGKANRWTRIYRQICRLAKQDTKGLATRPRKNSRS